MEREMKFRKEKTRPARCFPPPILPALTKIQLPPRGGERCIMDTESLASKDKNGKANFQTSMIALEKRERIRSRSRFLEKVRGGD
jgi:hypothetical protein